MKTGMALFINGERMQRNGFTEQKNNEPLTMYKNNSRFSSKFEGCGPLQLLCNWTGMKPANGYYSYTFRYQSEVVFIKAN